MKHLKMLVVLLPLVVLWAIVGATWEPFKSHFWMTMVCVVASVLLAMVAFGVVSWLFSRKRTQVR